MITFRNVVGYLETIADKHYMINSFHSGFMDEVDINKLGATDYVILYAEPGTAVIDRGVLTYNFTIYVLDMINEELGDSPNKERLGRVDKLSENLQVMQDVINEFHQNLHPDLSWVDSEVVLNLPINAEPFTARFDNLLTGWSATISMQVNNKNNLCISPIDPND
tara:strand:- start:7833 stop:8327 length:495 start_codon:yes stop_codon:yes gene_type:complete